MKKSVVILLFFLLSIVAIASLGFALYSYAQVQTVKKIASTAGTDSDQKMIAAIGSVIQLPDEKPTIVTITDKDKLQDQDFFKKAQNGDKVLIFEGIRRVFLFRPGVQKILDVAPLVFTDQKPSSIATISAQPVPESSASSGVQNELDNKQL